jgi:hypothetical protein
MKNIPQVSETMRWILGPVADELGWMTGFNQRSSGKVSGSAFVQSLVFSTLEDAQISYRQLSQAALDCGVCLTPQAMEARFSRAAADLVRRVLEVAVEQVIAGQPSAIPLLQRFAGVELRDSSVIVLPDVLQSIWPGVGGTRGATAAVKLQVRLDYCSGQLAGPILQAGREHDSHSPFQSEPLPQQAVRMGDLGFFSLRQFQQDEHQGVYWFSRLKVGLRVYDQDGKELDLPGWLPQLAEGRTERLIYLGRNSRLPARLIVERVPQEVAEQRRRKLKNNYAHKKQVRISKESLLLAGWTLIVTNIPLKLLSISEALVLLRLRWQIELLFRLWKSLFLIDEWRTHNTWRILAELYAKLLAVLILHWIGLTEVWLYPHHSLWKAALTVRHFATCLALALSDPLALQHLLEHLQLHLRKLCFLNPRRASPNAYQLLLDPDCTTLV